MKMAESKKYKVDFDEINALADSYFRAPDLTKREKLASKILSAMKEESPSERQNRLKNNPAAASYEDWVHIFGINAPYDLVIDIFYEAIGEKKLKNGENSKSGYKLGKGTKFTTYFIKLLSHRANGDGKKKPILVDVEEAPIVLPNNGEDDSFTVDVSEMAIVNMAGFFSEILKSSKAHPITRGVYSLNLVNYTRHFDETFIKLNDVSNVLFDPVEQGYIDKMTTFPEMTKKDFLSLFKSDFSEYVISNNLYFINTGELKQKSVSVYYNYKDNISKKIADLMEQCQKALKY